MLAVEVISLRGVTLHGSAADTDVSEDTAAAIF